MKKFLPGQRVRYRSSTGTVTHVGRTPGMVDVQYSSGITKRHRASDLLHTARKNTGTKRRRRSRRSRYNPDEASLWRKRNLHISGIERRLADPKKFRLKPKDIAANKARLKQLKALTTPSDAADYFATESLYSAPAPKREEAPVKKKAAGGSFKRPELIGGRQAALSPVQTLLAQKGAGFFTLPDPPRFAESRTGPHYVKDLCGNPIDGTLYVLALSEQGRFIKQRVTQKVWDTALRAWERKNRGSATTGIPDPEEVLKPLMQQGGWRSLIKIGRRPGAAPYPGADRVQLPFTADEVRRIRREGGAGTPSDRGAANYAAYSALFFFAENQKKFTGKEAGPYFKMLVKQMKKLGAMPKDEGQEARDIGRQTYLDMQEARLFTGRPFQRKLKQMAFFVTTVLAGRSPSFNAVGRGETIARDRSKDGKVGKAAARSMKQELDRMGRAEKAVVAETGQYGARGRRKMAKSRQADIQVEQPTRNSAFVRVPGERGYFMLNLARNESDAFRRFLTEAQPPWDDTSGKNTSPFFSWKRLDRPFDIRKPNFSAPPLCVTSEHRELLKAAREAKKPLGALVGTMKGMKHAMARGADPHEVYKKDWGDRSGTKALRILAWVASWAQSMLRTAKTIPDRHRDKNPALVVYDTIAKRKGARGGLDLEGLIKLGTAEPIPLISKSGRRTASILHGMEMSGDEDIDLSKKEREALFTAGERGYAGRPFTGKAGIVGQVEKELRSYVGYGMEPPEALAHLTATRMVSGGALRPKDMVREKRRLTRLAEPFFSTDVYEEREDPALPVLRALFVIYHSIGGDRTLLKINAAQRKLTYAISDGGRLPDARSSSLLRKLRKAEETRDHSEDAEERAVAGAAILDLERELRSRALGGRMNVLGKKVSLFYTFNPTLFLLTKSTWNRTGGAWVGAEERIEKRLARVDAVGQYGYALKLFYDRALGKKTLKEVQGALIDEVGIDAFRSEFDYKIKLKKEGREDPDDLLTAEGEAWYIRKEFPHLGLLARGEGGVHTISRRGDDDKPAGWYADSWRGNAYGEEVDAFIDDPRAYLEDRRKVAVAGMLGEQSEIDHERRERRERRARRKREGRAPRTPRWEVGEIEQVDITFGDDLSPLPIMGGPPHKVTPFLRREEESSWYPPTSGVAALEHLDRDSRTLRGLIQQRLQELKRRS